MKKLMMLLIAMINIFAFTSCNNEVADGTDDYTPSPDKDWFMPSINDVPGMLEGKCFRANEDGFKARLESGEEVVYSNFSITFKKNSILILTDDNDLNNSIELNYYNDIKYVERRDDYPESDHLGTYIEYKDYKNADEKNYIQLAFFGKKDNFCLGILLHSSQKIPFQWGALNYVFEAPIESGNETDVLFSDIHKIYLNNTVTEENLNAISDAYVLFEIYDGDDKNMYQYGIMQIDEDKNISKQYSLTNESDADYFEEGGFGLKLNKINEKKCWICAETSTSFSDFLERNNVIDISSYCIIDEALYEKYSNILPTGLF